MRPLLAAGLVALGLAVPGGFAAAQQPQTLRVSTYLPSTHWLVSDTLKQWAENVKAATKGKVEVNILPTTVGRPQDQFETARDGIVDIAMGVSGFTPGRFLISEFPQFAGSAKYSESSGAAAWRVLKTSPAAMKEFDGVELLAVHLTTPFNLFTTGKAIKAPSDFAGLKVHTPGGLAAKTAGAMGMAAILQPPSQAFEMLSNGVADGIIFTIDGITSFKLDRLIKQSMIIPGGFSNGGIAYLVMNKSRYDGLPADIKQALASVSGEQYARLVGKTWDERDRRGLEALQKAGSIVQTADAAVVNAMAEKTAALRDSWIASVKEKRAGADAAPALAAFAKEVKTIEAEIEARAK